MTVKTAGKTFVDQCVVMDGVDFEDCLFDGCVLTLNRAAHVGIFRCTVKDCLLDGDGWPRERWPDGFIRPEPPFRHITAFRFDRK